MGLTREQVASVTRARLEAAEGALLQLHRRRSRSEALPPGSAASSGGMRLAFPCAKGWWHTPWSHGALPLLALDFT